MANRLMWGYDDYDVTGMGYEFTCGGSPAIVAGRTGNCLRLGQGASIRKTVFPEGQATFTHGFAFRVDESNPASKGLWVCGDATRDHLLLTHNLDGTLSFYQSNQGALNFGYSSGVLLATSVNAISLGTWYYFEVTVTIDNAVGQLYLRVNGSDVWINTAANLDTQNGGTAKATWVAHCGPGTGGAQYRYFDDEYINDPSGSVCTGPLGDMRVDFHLADADGANTGWTPSTGTSHSGVVDENPPSVADYLSTATLNAVETLSVEGFKNDGADIQAIQVNVLASKADAGTCGLQTVIREGGTDTPSGVTAYPSTSWGYLSTNYSLAIGDAKRAAAGFDAAEYGMKKVA